MRIAILGAGAIGSILAAYLTDAGQDVVLIARSKRLEAIREHGVELTGLRELRVEVPAVEAADVEECDALIVATKTHQTEAALAGVAHIRCGLVTSFQNGTLKNALLAGTFGDQAVVGACTMVGGTLREDGVVDFFLNEETFLGELDGRRSERVEALAVAFHEAGLGVAVVGDIRSFEWTKLANQASTAAVAALTGLPMHLVWGNRRLAGIVLEQVREVVSVARALGVEPTDDVRFGFNIRALADAPHEEALEKVLARGRGLVERGMTNVRPSLATDVRAGRPTEIEETIGHAVREAERLGVPVPLLSYSYAAVQAVDAALDPAL